MRGWPGCAPGPGVIGVGWGTEPPGGRGRVQGGGAEFQESAAHPGNPQALDQAAMK